MWAVLRRHSGKTLSVLGGSAIFGCGWWYRPLPDRVNSAPPQGGLQALERRGWMSQLSLADKADEPLPLLFDVSRSIVTFVVVSLSRAFLVFGEDYDLIINEAYLNFVRAVASRPANTPLLTVSNHRSLLDEPTVLSSILPYWMNIQPKYVRYSLCAQEYCFNEKLGDILHGFVGLGKVLPIKRGAGLTQPLFRDFSRYFATGEWCHIFPEGGIWQLDTLGGRSGGKEKQIGKLKWGTGRLIAHSPEKPIVIPFCLDGMEKVIPHIEETKRVPSYIPKLGNQIRVKFGDELFFQDLIDEYELKHGKLWKLPKSKAKSTEQDDFRWNNPTAEELELYSKIGLRIEHHLENLQKELFSLRK